MLVWLRMWASIPFHTQNFKPLQNSSWLFSSSWVSPACKHPSYLTLHGYSVRSRLTLTSLLIVDFSQTSSSLNPSQNISPNRETGVRNPLLQALMLLAMNCIYRSSQLKCSIKPRATFSQQSHWRKAEHPLLTWCFFSLRGPISSLLPLTSTEHLWLTAWKWLL